MGVGGDYNKRCGKRWGKVEKVVEKLVIKSISFSRDPTRSAYGRSQTVDHFENNILLTANRSAKLKHEYVHW